MEGGGISSLKRGADELPPFTHKTRLLSSCCKEYIPNFNVTRIATWRCSPGKKLTIMVYNIMAASWYHIIKFTISHLPSGYKYKNHGSKDNLK